VRAHQDWFKPECAAPHHEAKSIIIISLLRHIKCHASILTNCGLMLSRNMFAMLERGRDRSASATHVPAKGYYLHQLFPDQFHVMRPPTKVPRNFRPSYGLPKVLGSDCSELCSIIPGLCQHLLVVVHQDQVWNLLWNFHQTTTWVWNKWSKDPFRGEVQLWRNNDKTKAFAHWCL